MKNLLLLSFLCFFFSANAQSELWTKEVSMGAFMSQLDDGKIFLKDKAKIYLVNNKNGEIEWENKVATKANPRFFDDLPIMYFDGKSYAVIDATTGYVVDESKVKTGVLNISYFWDIGRVVVELDRDKNLHILNMDLNDLSKSWNTKIGPVQKSMLGLVSRETENQPSITKDGSIVLADKKYISIVGPDGKIKKRIEFKKKIQKLGYNQENNILYVFEDNKDLHFIDVTNGNTNATLELKEDDLKLNVLGNGATIAIVQKKEIRILNGVDGSQMGSHEFKDKIKKSYIDEDSGRLFVLSKKLIAEIDHTSGDVNNESTFDKDFDEIYNVFGKTIISGQNGASPIDLSTLKLEYNKPANMPPVHDYVEMGDYIGYTYQIADKFSLHVVDQFGKVIWKESYSSIVPPSLDVIGEGLLMISGTKARYLSIEDGKSIWQDNVKVDPSFTYGIDENTDDMYMYSDKRIFKFMPSDGSLLRSDEKFKFKDFDYELQQPQLLVLPNNVFLKGSNTVYVISKEGELVHEKNYKRISTGSTLMKLANVVVTAAAIGSGNGGKVVTVYSGGQQVHKGSMVDGMNSTWEYAEGMKNERRAKQNRSSNAFPYVFTKMEDDKRGLIFINPENGDERFPIVLDEKDPNYLVDDIDGVLFHLSKNSLKAYDLK